MPCEQEESLHLNVEKILHQFEWTDSLLKDVLYSKPCHPKKLPASIKWGIDNDAMHVKHTQLT